MSLQQKMNQSTTEITQDAGGFLRCETCRRHREVDPRYWQTGWPKCCGYTMRWWTRRQVDAGEVPQ